MTKIKNHIHLYSVIYFKRILHQKIDVFFVVSYGKHFSVIKIADSMIDNELSYPIDLVPYQFHKKKTHTLNTTKNFEIMIALTCMKIKNESVCVFFLIPGIEAEVIFLFTFSCSNDRLRFEQKHTHYI